MCKYFLGHFIYKQLCILRLEFLIRENYPELYQQLKESEKWMEDQRNSNPYYAGPVKVNIVSLFIGLPSFPQ